MIAHDWGGVLNKYNLHTDLAVQWFVYAGIQYSVCNEGEVHFFVSMQLLWLQIRGHIKHTSPMLSVLQLCNTGLKAAFFYGTAAC